VVEDAGDGRTKVSAIDPAKTLTLVDDPVLLGPAEAVAGKLKAVLARL
jgi:hypothetical protein